MVYTVCAVCIYICIMANFRIGGFQSPPPVVKNIIIINVLVFLLQNLLEAKHVDVNDMLALHFWQSPYFKWWQLFTHMFMHASLAHIFFNMFALFMFGSVLENILGAKRFVLFYLICGLGAALCHLSVLAFQFHQFHEAFMYYQQHPTLTEYANFLQKTNITHPAFGQLLSQWHDNPDCGNCVELSVRFINEINMARMNEATVGASGAVFGLLFAFGYLLPNVELMLLFPPMPIKAKWLVTAYAAIELFTGLQNSADDNIAHFAHLGGMLFAFILLRLWNVRRTMW